LYLLALGGQRAIFPGSPMAKWAGDRATVSKLYIFLAAVAFWLLAVLIAEFVVFRRK
jgi:hypothetical protein